MTPFRPTREPRGEDRWLPAKMALFAGGAAFGVAGMVAERSWLVWVGVALLVAGLLLRFLPRAPAPPAE